MKRKHPPTANAEILIPHVGWLSFPKDDLVLRYLREGWFEYLEQAFLWLYLRSSDVVVDGGAHAGLFSALAARILNQNGRILSIEPNKLMHKHLQRNLTDAKASIELLPIALGENSGKRVLSVGDEAHAAWSTVAYDLGYGNSTVVETLSLNDLFRQANLKHADFVKIDTEGSELPIFRGAADLLARGKVTMFFVEFTEQNFQKSGYTSIDLSALLLANGYLSFSFDAEQRRIVPRSVHGPIEYENLIFTNDPESINVRLTKASHEHQRIAAEIIARGQTLTARIRGLEQDGEARLRVIDDLGFRLQEVEKDREARLGIIETLGARIREVDEDRAARLAVIETLTARVRRLEQELRSLHR